MERIAGVPRVALLTGDVSEEQWRIPSQSVRLIVTSPPYWGMRDYGIPLAVWGGAAGCAHAWGAGVACPTKNGRDGSGETVKWPAVSRAGPATRTRFCVHCGAWLGQLGLEPSPDLYVQHLVAIFHDLRRVLTPQGTFWLNLGDTYAGSGGAGGDTRRKGLAGAKCGPAETPQRVGSGLAPKNLVGIPWRVALALQADGWILRRDVIWSKPTCKPDPTRDRPATTHEYLFLFAQSRRYCYDRTQLPPGWHTHSVWTVPVSRYRGAHFATFPEELIEPIVRACSREGDTALDPFGGSGTVASVAARLGRDAIQIDIKSEYNQLTRERVGKRVGFLAQCVEGEQGLG